MTDPQFAVQISVFWVDTDGTVTHPPWNPSPAEFEAYREREVAMCRAARFADPATQGRDMLFSRETWGRAGVRA